MYHNTSISDHNLSIELRGIAISQGILQMGLFYGGVLYSYCLTTDSNFLPFLPLASCRTEVRSDLMPPALILVQVITPAAVVLVP